MFINWLLERILFTLVTIMKRTPVCMNTTAWTCVDLLVNLVYMVRICAVGACVICPVPTLVSTDIRLVGGNNQYEGRVEVYRSGEWQTVCDDSWDIKEAEVVCRQLGYGYAIQAIQRAAFGQGSDGQWDRHWFCNGNEASLDDCNSGISYCSHSEDASVICTGNGETSVGNLKIIWFYICTPVSFYILLNIHT